MKRLLPEKLLAALRQRATTQHELPDDVVRTSRHRVWVAAMLGAAAYALLLGLEMSGVVPGSPLEHRRPGPRALRAAHAAVEPR